MTDTRPHVFTKYIGRPRRARTDNRKPPTLWTDEKVQAMLRMIEDGDKSAGDIAEQLGTTRSAVLGRLARMGVAKAPPLTFRVNESSTEAEKLAQRAEAIRRQNETIEARRRRKLGVAFLKSAPGACRYIVDDTRNAQRVCGQPAMVGKPYCHFHYLACTSRRQPASEGV